MANTSNLGMSSGCIVNFVSWNVKSLNHPVKNRRVLTHLSHLKADIAFLQETHLRTTDHHRLRGGWIGQANHSNFGSKARGATILVSKNIPFVVSDSVSDPMGRYIIVVGRLYGFPVILANIYAPNWYDHTFFINTFSQIPNMDSHHLILGGDTNCVLSPNLDRSSSKTSSDSKSAQTIQLFLQAYGVVESGVSSTLHLGAIPFFPRSIKRSHG